MTKLPPLSVLLAPHGHGHVDHHLRAPSSSYYDASEAASAAEADRRRSTPLYSYAYNHNQPQQRKVYTSPASPSSPSWGPPFAQRHHTQLPSPPSFHSSQHQHYQQEPWYPLNAVYQSSEGQQDVLMASSSSVQFHPRDASRETVSSSSASSVLQCTMTQPATQPKTGTTTGSVRRPKASRYLREMDRRAIIKRLDDGEKQCALAKEFNVSRSSICNLFKHRAEVLGRAHHLSPFSKHPKKKCKKNALRQQQSVSISSSAVGSSTASICV